MAGDDMLIWIGLGVSILYAIGWMHCWRIFAWRYAQDSLNSHNDAMVFGFFTAAIWPLAWAFMTLSAADAFLLPPKQVRAEEKRKAMQRRIDELERELNLR
jgi:hypothetical protein